MPLIAVNTLSQIPTKQLASIEDSLKSLAQSGKVPTNTAPPQQHVMSVTAITHDSRTNFCPS